MEGSRDPRMEYLMDYTLRTLRLKPDKWSRMLVSDEQRTFVNAFIDRPGPQVNSFFCLKITEKVAFNIRVTLKMEIPQIGLPTLLVVPMGTLRCLRSTLRAKRAMFTI